MRGERKSTIKCAAGILCDLSASKMHHDEFKVQFVAFEPAEGVWVG